MGRREGFYDQLSPQQLAEMHQRYYEIEKDKKEKKDSFGGNIIKVGNYTYGSQSYEDEVNKWVEELMGNAQKDVNKYVKEQQDKNDKVQAIWKKNDMQSQIKKIVDRNEER